MMDEDSAGFGELLQQAEQLTADIDGNTDLPRVQRNLKQILEEGQQLWSRTAQLSAKDTTDVKASILLGSQGFDLPKVSKKLESLSAVKSFEPIEPIHETDIDSFLRNERENALLSVIQESTKTTLREADDFYWQVMSSDWQREKQRILNSLLGSSNEVMDVSVAQETTVFPVDMKTRSAMSATEVAYAREVYLYNEQVVLGGLRPNLAERFKVLAKEGNDRGAADLWDMVCALLDAPRRGVERDEAFNAGFVRQARRYLERSYCRYMRMIVQGNLEQASMGGVPGTLNLVTSFLNVKAPVVASASEGTVLGQPVWALVYLCLRCGDLDAAAEVCRRAGAMAGELAPLLEECAASEDRRLGPSSENKVRLQYTRSGGSASGDPFKQAVFCVLGRCDVAQDHAQVATTVEDYLWLHLCQVHTEELQAGEEEPQDWLTLSRLQRILLEDHGESHFDAQNQPFLYFQVLFLTAQFEAAIEFLSRYEPLRCHAVHVALVLYEAGLVTPPHSVQAGLVSKAPDGGPPRLNLARLVTSYTRKFEATDPREALNYFYFLRKLKGVHGENLFVACVSELVLETREFDALLGKMERDGCRRPGAVDRFQADTHRIVEAVAGDCEKRGLYEDAVRLLDLCGKHDEAVRLLNRLLGQQVPLPSGPAWERLHSLAVELAERYRSHGTNASADATSALYLLLDLGLFFLQARQGQAVLALETMRKLQIIPLDPSEVEASARALPQRSEEVRRILADVLLAVMNLLYSRYKELKGGERDEERKRLKLQAQAILEYAGMIPYRMPGDTNARLVQMEVLMS
ncbi:nuclear pore complex protein Nup93 [Ixodes scapularis]